MDKLKLQKMYEILYEIYSQSYYDCEDYKRKKNKKIRDYAGRKVCNAIRRALYHVNNCPELYELLTGGKSVSDYDRIRAYNYFTLPHDFGSNLWILLNKIEEKINALQKEEI